MGFRLNDLAAEELTHDLTIRGQTVPVRWVPSKIQRIIERLIQPPIVIADDEEAVEKRKREPTYKAQLREVEFQRQCLRAAYAADIEIDDLTFSEKMSREDAAKLAAAVSNTLTDLELGQIYQASYAALVRGHDPKEQIGTEHEQGN